jgi:phosphatidylglycerol:prolipoprotein diacylglycerol transferase
MIPYNSFYSINLRFITIQSWGLMVAIGFALAIWLALKEAKRKKLDQEKIYGISTIALLGGILGCRALWLIENWRYYLTNPSEILKIWDGGMSYFGGLITVILLLIWYVKKHKLNFFKYADCVTPALILGQALGRIGCILGDGGHLGKITTIAWGALYNGEIRHLTAAYELIGLIILFAIFMHIRKKQVFDGLIFTAYMVSYGVLRLIIDYFRVDPTYLGLTIAQYVSIAIIAISGTILIMRSKNENKKKHK